MHIYALCDMLMCMRTTIDVGDELLRQAKARAVKQGVPLRVVVEEALRLYLRQPGRQSGYKLQWRTTKGRMLPGVRLDDRDALFDLMEDRH